MECLENFPPLIHLPPKCTEMKLGLLDEKELSEVPIEPENPVPLNVNNNDLQDDDDEEMISCISAQDPIEIRDDTPVKEPEV